MGIAMPGATGWLLAFGALALTALLLAAVLRRRVRGGGRTGAGQGHRLSIVETREIDDQRRLLIVRCDGTDHLVLVGGGSDVLLKADLARPEPRVTFPSPIVDERSPELPPFVESPIRPEPRRREPAPRFEMPNPPMAGRPEPATPTIPAGVESFMPTRSAARSAPNVTPPVTTQPTEPRFEMPAPAPREMRPPQPAARVVSEAPAQAPTAEQAAEPDFSEMTRKLEEALKRTASLRPPGAAIPSSEPTPAGTPGESSGVATPEPPRTGDDASLAKAGDPFEEEIRRLLGRELPKT